MYAENKSLFVVIEITIWGIWIVLFPIPPLDAQPEMDVEIFLILNGNADPNRLRVGLSNDANSFEGARAALYPSRVSEMSEAFNCP